LREEKGTKLVLVCQIFLQLHHLLDFRFLFAPSSFQVFRCLTASIAGRRQKHPPSVMSVPMFRCRYRRRFKIPSPSYVGRFAADSKILLNKHHHNMAIIYTTYPMYTVHQPSSKHSIYAISIHTTQTNHILIHQPYQGPDKSTWGVNIGNVLTLPTEISLIRLVLTGGAGSENYESVARSATDN
jgi:hypothetical protein